jgi:hypothetical protein
VKIEQRAEPRDGAPTGYPVNGGTRDEALGRPPAAPAANGRPRASRRGGAPALWPEIGRQRAGAILLVAVIVVVIAAAAWPGEGKGDLTLVKGFGGQLKVNVLSDPDVAAILAEEHELTVDITEMPSIEALAQSPQEGTDFIWAGDQSTLDTYRDRGGTMLEDENIYYSPIVLYSWTPIVEALVAQGTARIEPSGAYTVDLATLVDLVIAGRAWDEIGVTDMNGTVSVQTTDPARSNSGLQFSGLLANVLNGGRVVDSATVQTHLPEIRAFFAGQGFMVETSGDLFAQFLILGRGAAPIVAGYESQAIEYVVEHPDRKQWIEENVRVLYPRPTVWASHPMIALTEEGRNLIGALTDPAIQRLAWEGHGQRPSETSVPVDPSVMDVPWVLVDVASVTRMPSSDVMNQIRDTISPPDEATASPPPSVLAALTTAGAFGRRRVRFRRRRSEGRRARARARLAYCRQNNSTAPRSASTFRSSSSAV